MDYDTSLDPYRFQADEEEGVEIDSPDAEEEEEEEEEEWAAPADEELVGINSDTEE